ncbi:unnamed protein product [Diabrotica balteata]|uniref:Uncharacterized protein n=1 Tax=Diabrotica balteata TaxID=107213 RepID=A0A9N9ST27_DIABA|nr:unnamed protein product [Diabrotica balteata]
MYVSIANNIATFPVVAHITVNNSDTAVPTTSSNRNESTTVSSAATTAMTPSTTSTSTNISNTSTSSSKTSATTHLTTHYTSTTINAISVLFKTNISTSPPISSHTSITKQSSSSSLHNNSSSLNENKDCVQEFSISSEENRQNYPFKRTISEAITLPMETSASDKQ